MIVGPNRASASGVTGAARWAVHGTAIAALAMCLVVFAYDTVRGWPGGSYQFVITVANAFVGLAYLGIGWLLASRRKGNIVGPLLLAYGLLWLAAGPIDVYLGQLPRRGPVPLLADAGATFMFSVGIPLSALLSLVLVVFPDGRPLTRRWGLAGAIGAGLAAVGILGTWLGSTSFAPFYPRLGSPFAVPGFPLDAVTEITDKTLTALSILGIASLGVRWVRGTSLERAQVTWVVAAGAVSFATARVAVAFGANFDTAQVVTSVMASIGSALVPIAIGIAIMRYRLYEIDRIVSRTVAYAAITAVLAVVFVAVDLAMLLLISVLAGGGGGTASTAVATLAAAALFTPVRGRAQRVVDRRFHRRHYDAQQLVDAFAGRLRDQVDLGLVGRELQTAVVAAVEPAAAGLWLRHDRG